MVVYRPYQQLQRRTNDGRHPWSHFTYTTRRKVEYFFKGIPFVKINVSSRDALVVSTCVVVLFTLLALGFSLLTMLRRLSLVSREISLILRMHTDSRRVPPVLATWDICSQNRKVAPR